MILHVEGTPATRVLSSTPSNVTSHNLPGPSGVGRFGSRIFPTMPTHQTKKESRCNVRIVQAKVTMDESKKLVFNKIGQVFIDLNEVTANINYVTTVVQQTFGLDYVVVTADGLRIHDGAGTQG